MRLSPEVFRAFVLSLSWAVSNRTDGRVEVADLDMVPGCSLDSAAALVNAGLWTPADDGTGWQIVDFLNTQTSRDKLEGLELRKRQDADRSKSYRQRKKAGEHVTESRDDHVTGTRDDIGKARPGQDRLLTTHTSTREEVPASSSGCVVPGCPTPITEYARREYGGWYCAPHGEEPAGGVPRG